MSCYILMTKTRFMLIWFGFNKNLGLGLSVKATEISACTDNAIVQAQEI